VFPRLVAAEHRQTAPQAPLPSGLRELDDLLGGGISEGTSTLLVGSAGTGKSTLAALFGIAAAKAGKRAAFFLFDENPQTLVVRCQQLGMDLQPHIDAGGIVLKQVDPAELTPGELIHTIRQEVEEAGANVVVIDSLNGYLNAMPGERFLAVQLHELLMYLGQKNVATILIGAQHGVIGTQMSTPIDTSYLADAVVLLRYYEVDGEVRQAISVIKKRGGRHERTLREFRLDGGVRVGAPLRHLRGVLTGVPTPQGRRSRDGDDHD
jgi:circadian clock protein KaiC